MTTDKRLEKSGVAQTLGKVHCSVSTEIFH